jgi:hypothetical protein
MTHERNHGRWSFFNCLLYVDIPMPFNRIFVLALLMSCISQTAYAFEFQVPDGNLQQCLLELVEKKQWQTIEDVTEISCHSKKIRSLSGLEQFAKLQKLSLYNNQLSELNLTGLAELKHLNVAKNTLQNLTLGGLPVLEELYIFNNKLKSLNLADLPKLTLVKFNNNQITEFTYSNLPKLEKLYLFNNNIKHLDIYQLPAMHYMDARQNPMPDKLYEEMDAMKGVTFLHDGNAEDWQ